MKYLSSWLPAGEGQRWKKLHVKVKALKLEGIQNNGDKRAVVVVVAKWQGPKKTKLSAPFYKGLLNKCKKNYTSHKPLKRGEDVEWDDEFENVCSFAIDPEDGNSQKKKCFSSWKVSFNILCGEDRKAKTKLVKIGKVSVDIAQVANSMIGADIEKRLPISLQIDGVIKQATLSLLMSFADIRSSTDSSKIVHDTAWSNNEQPKRISRSQTASGIIIHDNEPVSSICSNESTLLHSSELLGNESSISSKNGCSEIQCNSDIKAKLWKKNRWSFTLSKRQREPSIEKINAVNDEFDSQPSNSWEVKELVSRDGGNKLKANVFFASFDQRSDKAAGESACATLVAVIAHWLQSNQALMPTRSQFDSLIAEGSSEWRKLCENDAYTKSFPDNHFDLETVLDAELRPLNILWNKSFTGIFNPEKFENLKGAKSFDDIWEEISSITEDHDQRIYIVSWNDHFFVLKADAEAYYIIDSLGERLFEGCTQAYILKFDESTLMYQKAPKEENSDETEKHEVGETEDVICKGKECCREFMKRFLAAIPISELEEQEKKGCVSSFTLLRRLQIDFQYCSPSSSSSTASPISSVFSPESCSF